MRKDLDYGAPPLPAGIEYEAKGQWNASFIRAQAEMPDIKKSKTANIPTKSGGSFKYSYADLAAIIPIVKKTLAEHDLGFAQDVAEVNGNVAVYTRIYHSAGHVEVFGPVVLPAGTDAREAGSAITYARRYGLTAALGIAADEDVDGQQASAPRGLRGGDRGSGSGDRQPSGEAAGPGAASAPSSSGDSGASSAPLQASEEAGSGEPPGGSQTPPEPASRRPVCSANGLFHKADPERTSTAKKGYEVCACGYAKKIDEKNPEWASAS